MDTIKTSIERDTTVLSKQHEKSHDASLLRWEYAGSPQLWMCIIKLENRKSQELIFQ